MQGMEAALLDKTRRASRTETEAKETRAELDGLPESVRASLTQGVPLETDAEEAYVAEAFDRCACLLLQSKRLDARYLISGRPFWVQYGSKWTLTEYFMTLTGTTASCLETRLK